LKENAAGLLCYLGLWITGLIFFLIDRQAAVRAFPCRPVHRRFRRVAGHLYHVRHTFRNGRRNRGTAGVVLPGLRRYSNGRARGRCALDFAHGQSGSSTRSWLNSNKGTKTLTEFGVAVSRSRRASSLN